MEKLRWLAVSVHQSRQLRRLIPFLVKLLDAFAVPMKDKRTPFKVQGAVRPMKFKNL